MQDTFIVNQVSTFAVTVILGLAIGLSYDTLRALKGIVRISRSTQFVIDFCYWLLMTILVFVALLASNWGEVRLYVFIGIGIGGMFYTLVLSKPYFLLTSKVLQALVTLLLKIVRPIVFIVGKIKSLAILFGRKVSIKATSGKQTVKKIKFRFSRKKKE